MRLLRHHPGRKNRATKGISASVCKRHARGNLSLSSEAQFLAASAVIRPASGHPGMKPQPCLLCQSFYAPTGCSTLRIFPLPCRRNAWGRQGISFGSALGLRQAAMSPFHRLVSLGAAAFEGLYCALSGPLQKGLMFPQGVALGFVMAALSGRLGRPTVHGRAATTSGCCANTALAGPSKAPRGRNSLAQGAALGREAQCF
jgi:hypothetical protein